MPHLPNSFPFSDIEVTHFLSSFLNKHSELYPIPNSRLNFVPVPVITNIINIAFVQIKLHLFISFFHCSLFFFTAQTLEVINLISTLDSSNLPCLNPAETDLIILVFQDQKTKIPTSPYT